MSIGRPRLLPTLNPWEAALLNLLAAQGESLVVFIDTAPTDKPSQWGQVYTDHEGLELPAFEGHDNYTILYKLLKLGYLEVTLQTVERTRLQVIFPIKDYRIRGEVELVPVKATKQLAIKSKAPPRVRRPNLKAQRTLVRCNAQMKYYLEEGKRKVRELGTDKYYLSKCQGCNLYHVRIHTAQTRYKLKMGKMNSYYVPV